MPWKTAMDFLHYFFGRLKFSFRCDIWYDIMKKYWGFYILCIRTMMGENSMKLVVTTVGKDRVGIIAMVSNILAENNINILSVNQNIMDGFFNMVMMAETVGDNVKLPEMQKLLRERGQELDLEIKVQNQEIFNIMHNI